MTSKFTFVYLIIVMCLLAEGAARSKQRNFYLQSQFRKHNRCMGGNLMKIHIDAACQASNGPCKAKCDGSTTRDANTRFSIETVRGMKCIQFTDVQAGSGKYALKVINGTDLVFEQRPCNSTIGSDFLFREEKVMGRLFRYKHTSTSCLGVSDNCADLGLHLISTNGGSDQRCSFKTHRVH